MALRDPSRDPLHNHAYGAGDLGLPVDAAHNCWHYHWPQLVRRSQQPVPRQSNPPLHPRQPLVLAPVCYLDVERAAAVWVDIYRDVLHFYLLLELQVLLRLRFHAAGLHYPACCIGMRLDRLHLLSPQRGGLPMALDKLDIRCLDGCLRLYLCDLLLFHQDQDDWDFPDHVLLWLYVDVLFRHLIIDGQHRLPSFLRIRQENLQKHKVRLRRK